jgi:hypothetical protein
MTSPACFEPIEFNLRETVVYRVWYVLHASVQNVPYTTVSLRKNPPGSKFVGDIRI